MIDMLGLAILHLQTTSRERPGDDQWYYDLFGPPPSVRRMRRQARRQAARSALRLFTRFCAAGGVRRNDVQRASGVPS